MHLATLYGLFGLNQWLFLAINKVHGGAIDGAALAGSLLGNFWNFPIDALLLGAAAWASTERPALAQWLPDRSSTLRVLVTLALG